MNIGNLPKLVDISKYPNLKIIPEKPSFFSARKKWNLNKILLSGFILFTIFFLYNCKYGFFKVNVSPVAYTQN